MDTLTIRRPDDWHLHFRDDAVMQGVVPFTARQFARADSGTYLAARDALLVTGPTGTNVMDLLVAVKDPA